MTPAERSAKALPCKSVVRANGCHYATPFGHDVVHDPMCPAIHRPAVAAAIQEAVKAALADENRGVIAPILAKHRHELKPACFEISEEILAALRLAAMGAK